MLILATLAYVVGAAIALRSLMTDRLRRSAAPVLLALAGFVLHTFSLLWNWAAIGQFPISSPHHTLALLAWCAMLLFLVCFRVFRQPPALVSFFLPIVVLFSLASLGVSLAPGEPGAGSSIYWRAHGILMLLGCGAFALAFVTSVMYLLQERQLKTKALGRLLERLPSLESLDRMTVLCTGLGFVFYTLALVAAAIGWKTDGRPPGEWLRTPVGVVSAVTWLLYLCAVNARLLPPLRGKKLAYLTILGFVLVLFTLALLFSADVLHPGMGALGSNPP